MWRAQEEPRPAAGATEFAIREDAFHHQFAADVPAEQAALMFATQRPVTQAALSTGLPTDQPAWKTIPSGFPGEAPENNSRINVRNIDYQAALDVIFFRRQRGMIDRELFL